MLNKRQFYIDEKDEGVRYRATMATEESEGFVTATLVRHGEGWTERARGKACAYYIELDGHVQICVNEQWLDISICDANDLRILLETIQRTTKPFAQIKVIEGKEVR